MRAARALGSSGRPAMVTYRRGAACPARAGVRNSTLEIDVEYWRGGISFDLFGGVRVK
jgi:hypothetical protein